MGPRMLPMVRYGPAAGKCLPEESVPVASGLLESRETAGPALGAADGYQVC